MKRVLLSLRLLALVVTGMALPVLLHNPLFAQGGAQGAITGTIIDPSNAVIPNAKITITNQGTGVIERTLTTGSQGTFSATLLPIGTYKVEVTATGFSKTEASGIAVRVSETSFISLQMKVGTTSEEVSVSGAAAQVEITNPTTGEALSGEVIREMPLATRNFLGLLALSAGTNSEFADTTALGRGQTTIIVNGQRPVNNNYQLEGINANDVSLPQFDNVNLPNPDVVEEFKTQTSLYDASQGRNGGGNMQVNLRSGTDKYHGDAFEYFRNNLLDANDWFLKRSELTAQPPKPNKAPVLRQNAFGASFGGPVPGIKNFFFFGNYSGVREASAIAKGTTISTSIPILPSSRDAATLMSTFGVTSIDPVALAWLNLPASKCPGFNDGTHCIPSLPGTPGVVAGATNTATLQLAALGTYADDQFTITVDKKIGSKDSFTARWFDDKAAIIQPFGEHSSLPFSLNFPLKNRFLKLGLTHVFSSTAVNDFRFGFARYNFNQTPTEPISLTDIGSTRPNSADFAGAWKPIVSGGGGFSIGADVNDNRGTADNTFVWGDNFSKTIGKHTLRVGGEIDRWQLNRYNHFAKRGSVSFSTNTTTFPGLNGFQDFLEGNINTTQGQAGIDKFYFRATDAGAYVQDDWKVTSRVTLNLGVRWEAIDYAHVIGNFLTNLGGFAHCSSTGCASDGLSDTPLHYIHPSGAPGGFGTPGVSDCTLLTCFSWKNFSPRVGFAWDVFGDHKTALRGGYGTYYQRASNQSELQSAGGPPFSVQFKATAGSVTTANPFPQLLPNSAFPLALTPGPNGNTLGPTAFGIPSGYPQLNGFDTATGTPSFDNTNGNLGGLAATNSGLQFFPVRGFRPPYSQQWNLTIQREVASGWMVELGYVGASGVFLLGPGRAPNAGQTCTLARPCVIPKSALSPNFIAPAAGTPNVAMNSDGSVSITGSSAANVDARVFVPFLGSESGHFFLQENNSHSTYHSLQASLVHQLAKGLYFQAAYTWSKSLDNASGSETSDELNGLTQFGDLLNTNSNRGLSDFDRTHRLVISYSYELPFGSTHGFGNVLHGWTLQGATSFQSGTPFAIYDAASPTISDPNFNDGSNLATLTPGTPLSAVLTKGSKLDKINAFVNPNVFTIGGLCVDSQGNTLSIPVTDPGCTSGLAAPGNVRRNSFRGFFQQEWDFSVHKVTKITERLNFVFGADFFNLFNHPAFSSPQAGQGGAYTAFTAGSNGNYGGIDISSLDTRVLNTVNRPRIVQFVGKITF
ncbi:MAG TPA: TonB-dependent receptor [Candidatus Sulfotelmatobacter sp.]|nr:TonB-dependent receptor [Candidatus Sulfotelmatobacter sp.]